MPSNHSLRSCIVFGLGFGVYLSTQLACGEGSNAGSGSASNTASVPAAAQSGLVTPQASTSVGGAATAARSAQPSAIASSDLKPPLTPVSTSVVGSSPTTSSTNKPAASVELSAGDAGVSGATAYAFVAVSKLPSIKEMPDPLTMWDGTKVTTPEQWKIRRQEMIRILEDYEYGHMPPAPGNVKAEAVGTAEQVTAGAATASYRKFHLTFGVNNALGFDVGLFTPTTALPEGATGFPVLINLTSSADKGSLGSASAALSRGYAVASVPYSQLGADAKNYASTAFFPAYPDYDWRDFSAWAWGISRAVDFLVTEPSVDGSKILVTGVSRLAQAALLVGAFDERIALTAPVAGGAALRYSGSAKQGAGLGQGIKEVVDQNTYWFGPRFEEFKTQTERLPCDQHWLLALAAPRLFILSNSLEDQYGRAYAAAQTYLSAQPVYDFLGVPDNLGVHFRPGTHGITAENWSAILDFSDQFLLKKAGTRKFNVLPAKDQLP